MSNFLKRVMRYKLEESEVSTLTSSFDTIGSIVILRIPEALVDKRHMIGDTILDSIKSARSVYMQTSPIAGVHRTRKLELIAGVDNPVTFYKEYDCRFKVDVEQTYFSPRLSTERFRIANLASENEVVTNMFAGVGTFSIIMCRYQNVKKIYNVDINQVAHELSVFNSRLNKMEGKIESFCGDAKEIANSNIKGKSDRVLMPLPERARYFITDALNCLKEEQGVIHYFLHVRADSKKSALEYGRFETDDAFRGYSHDIKFLHVVREVGPCLYQLVSDVLIGKGNV
ncbi:MAG: class I SAM-dependent methyltransferase family protein [Nitrososphaeraceae archaeon]